MGMTMWAINTGNFTYNQVGHAFVELWNNYGTHNTFSRWDTSDNQCTRFAYLDANNNVVYLNNNICDQDVISVDVELNAEYGLRNAKYNNFRRYGIYLDKSNWDYIVFSSGFRNNYWNGGQVDMGGSGTYNWYTSMSRSSSYGATYGANQLLPDTRYVCSGYSIKLWNAYRRSGDKYFDYTSITFPYPYSPTVIYNQM
jgi:hypothetical protein